MKFERAIFLFLMTCAIACGMAGWSETIATEVESKKIQITYAVHINNNDLVITSANKAIVENDPESEFPVERFINASPLASMCFTAYVATSGGSNQLVIFPASGRKGHDLDAFVFTDVPDSLTVPLKIKKKDSSEANVEYSIKAISGTKGGQAVDLAKCSPNASEKERCATLEDLQAKIGTSNLWPADGARVCVNAVSADSFLSPTGVQCAYDEATNKFVTVARVSKENAFPEEACETIKITCGGSYPNYVYCSMGGVAIKCGCRK